jgi:hypothetical protein
MKNLAFLLFLLVFLAGCKKDPEPTSVTVVITENPMGGSRQELLSVSFNATMKGVVKPIELTVEWWWENAYHSNQKLQKTSRVLVNVGGVNELSDVYSAGIGYYFLNYHWVKIKWTDELGSHEIESPKAYCSDK